MKITTAKSKSLIFIAIFVVFVGAHAAVAEAYCVQNYQYNPGYTNYSYQYPGTYSYYQFEQATQSDPSYYYGYAAQQPVYQFYQNPVYQNPLYPTNNNYPIYPTYQNPTPTYNYPTNYPMNNYPSYPNQNTPTYNTPTTPSNGNTGGGTGQTF